MKTSESIITMAPALLKAQKSIGSAKKGAVNPFFHSAYATLGDVMQACKDILNENGISVLQPIGSDENGVYVNTILLHESGEYISDKMRISVKSENDPQAQGSAITYARRYSLQSMVFIPAEDDDANKAMGERKTTENKKTTASTGFVITGKQRAYIKRLLAQKGKTEKQLFIKYDITDINQLTGDQASTIIENLLKLDDKPKDTQKQDELIDIEQIDKELNE